MRSLCVAIMLVACGDDTVDPSEATASDLYGIWTSDIAPGAEGTGISFLERAVYHPLLVGKTNVYAMYQRTEANQLLEELGTYRVAGGILYRTPVGATTEYERDLYAISRGGSLSIEGENASEPRNDYYSIPDCNLSTRSNGWRTHSVQRATWSGRNEVGGNPVTVQFFDGVMMGTQHNLVFAYRDDCIPEVDGADLVGGAELIPTNGGMHVLVGLGVGDTRMALYAKLTSSTIPIPTPQPIPVMAKDIVDFADIGGTLTFMMQGSPASIVRADGTTIALPATLPSAFVPKKLIDLGGHLAVVGTGGAPQRMWLLEQEGANWTQTMIPFDVGAGTLTAATAGDDVYIAHASGTIMFVTRRIGGTWIPPVATSAGGEPHLAIAGDGVVHLSTSFYVSANQIGARHAMLDGDTVRGWMVPPYPALTHAPTATIRPPRPAIGPDGLVAIGYASDIQQKDPDDHDPTKVPLRIEITGTGRVTSSDGSVNCTQTCTVDVEQGSAVLLRTEPAANQIIGGDAVQPPYAYVGAVSGGAMPVYVTF